VTGALRVTRLGAATGALAMALALVAAANLTAAPVWRGTATVTAVTGVVVLVAVLWRWADGLAVALTLLAAPAAFALANRDEVFVASVPWAVALLCVGELASWSLDAITAVPPSRAVEADRAARTAALLVGAAGVSTLVLATAGLPSPRGLLAEIVGLAAALGVLLLASMPRARRPR
jgi:hypothetical protein